MKQIITLFALMSLSFSAISQIPGGFGGFGAAPKKETIIPGTAQAASKGSAKIIGFLLDSTDSKPVEFATLALINTNYYVKQIYTIKIIPERFTLWTLQHHEHAELAFCSSLIFSSKLKTQKSCARSKKYRQPCLYFSSSLSVFCRVRKCRSKWSKDFFMLNLVFASKKALMRGVHDDVQSQFFKLLKNLLFGSSRSRTVSRCFITNIGLQIDYKKSIIM